MPATQAASDATYFGHDERFYELNIHMTVAKGGTWTGTWQYYNGTSWASLTDVTDGTANYATTGAQTVTFAIPDDWEANVINSATRYWIRFFISSFTSTGTVPVLATASIAMAGDIRLEDAAVEMIGCTLTQMGSVRVRSGAFLKKTLITDSIVPAKHGAIDLGGADPSTDTVRDLTIQNCIAGILLKGSGNVTYNFRNIKFAGNTNNVRVDFGGGDTVTINVLEGGTGFTASAVDNVNSSTLIINAGVTTAIHVNDNTGADEQGVRVYIRAKDGTGPLPYLDSVTITNTTVTAHVAHTAHGLVNGQKIEIKGANESEYNGVSTISNVATNTYDYTMPSDPGGSATGTITATGIILDEDTDANGDVTDSRTLSSDQPMIGWARKGSGSPFFEQGEIDDVIDSDDGFSLTIKLILDE